MAYEIQEIERQNGEVQNVYIDTGYTDLNTLATDMFQAIQNSVYEPSTSLVRGNTSRPMMKTSDNDKIYIREDDNGDVRIRLNLASEQLTDIVLDFLGYGQEEADQEWQDARGGDQYTQDDDEETERTTTSPPDSHVSFEPPYTKDESNYQPPDSGENPHWNCKDCVHFVEGGQCQMVQGNVIPDGHCEDLYADLSVHGRIKDGAFETNLAATGEKFVERFRQISINDIMESIRKALRGRL